MTIVEFKRVHHWARRNSRIIWPIGEEEYHACLSRKRTPVQIWYGSPYRGECSKAGEAVSKTAWVGSIPNRPCHFSGCSSVSRARGLGPRGREGGTHHSDQYGPVIQ